MEKIKQKIKTIPRKKFVMVSLFVLPVFVALFLNAAALIVRANFATWGDSSLVHACLSPRGIPSIVDSTESCGQNETEATWLKDINVGEGLSLTRTSSGAAIALDDTSNNGWVAVNETWTYDSADDPSFTFTISGDKTGKYSPGMRVKISQTSVKYFLITKVSYSSPDTTITIYGGTDYDLANATISSPYYSMVKAPQGFPLNPNKWTVEISSTSTATQANPTVGTWYNLNSLSIDIPIGVWNVTYHIPAYTTGGTNTSTASFTLSTSSSSESDPDFTSILGSHGTSDAHGVTLTKSKTLVLDSKTTYYVIEKVDVATYLLTLLNSYSKLFVKAESSYL